MRLREIVGDVKEEDEPEGEVVVEPSREAIVHSSGNMIPISLAPIIIILYSFFSFQPFQYVIGFHFNLDFLSFPWSISCADESESEEGAKVETEEGEKLGILWSWMEVGGLPALDEVEAQKLL